MSISILFSLSVLLAIWGMYEYLGYRAKKTEWKKRTEEWYDIKSKRKSFIIVWGDRFDRTPHAKEVQQKLVRANIALAPSEYYGILLIGAMGVAFFLNNVVGLHAPYNLVGGAACMYIAQNLMFIVRRNKYQERLNDQLSDVCRLLANSLRAGMTLSQGIELVAKEIPQPAGQEFSRMARELQLGVSFDRALTDMEKRIPTRDFRIFAATLFIQRRAGGNLSEVLQEMAETLEDRRIVNQEIKTMTAEQRYVSILVPIMPIALVLMMNTMNEGFIDPLFSGFGLVLLGFFIVGTVLSYVLVKKVTNIKV
ncbi:type II secretion system F family protein [Brevibacillus choshinensis]|uniref:Type II secretion system F family protein n=1 Tax=Brevibacillus choshinensis TaxID=54911 RepID=A0ABX7FRI2_BRECH|nr:type II secretion system F family protein [Brevibacillus choshinensis]QRG68214.1 type II secretion system F family protein [Brevibacillus choshinensis]